MYKRPFVSLVLLITLYYALVVLFFDPVPFSVKKDFIVSSVLVLLFYTVFDFAFKAELDKISSKIFPPLGMRGIRSIALIVPVSIILIIVLSLLQYMLTSISVPGGTVALGYPLSVYSFSVHKMLFFNIISNILIVTALIYFEIWVLNKRQKKN